MLVAQKKQQYWKYKNLQRNFKIMFSLRRSALHTMKSSLLLRFGWTRICFFLFSCSNSSSLQERSTTRSVWNALQLASSYKMLSARIETRWNKSTFKYFHSAADENRSRCVPWGYLQPTPRAFPVPEVFWCSLFLSWDCLAVHIFLLSPTLGLSANKQLSCLKPAALAPPSSKTTLFWLAAPQTDHLNSRWVELLC